MYRILLMVVARWNSMIFHVEIVYCLIPQLQYQDALQKAQKRDIVYLLIMYQVMLRGNSYH